MIRAFKKKWNKKLPYQNGKYTSNCDRRTTALEKEKKRVFDSQTAADIVEAMGEGGGDDNKA